MFFTLRKNTVSIDQWKVLWGTKNDSSIAPRQKSLFGSLFWNVMCNKNKRMREMESNKKASCLTKSLCVRLSGRADRPPLFAIIWANINASEWDPHGN